jgi:hypothetical protein
MIELLAAAHIPAAPPAASERLTDFHRGAILGALATYSRGDLRSLLTELSADGSSARRVTAVIGVLAELGDSGDLVFIVKAARNAPPPAEGTGLERGVAEAVKTTFVRILERDPHAPAEMSSLGRSVSGEMRLLLVRAVDAWGGPGAADLLANLLVQRSDQIAVTLTCIGKQAERSPVPLTAVAEQVRPFLEHADDEVALAAAECAGKLADFDALPRLFDLLESDEPGLRENAHWACRNITGLPLRPDPEAWREWYAEEMQWWDEVLPELLDDLRDPEPQVVLAAIAQIATRRQRRDELAQDLVVVLTHTDPQVRRLTCASLRRLGSVLVLEELEQRLLDDDEGVREEAGKAFEALSAARRGT